MCPAYSAVQSLATSPFSLSAFLELHSLSWLCLLEKFNFNQTDIYQILCCSWIKYLGLRVVLFFFFFGELVNFFLSVCVRLLHVPCTWWQGNNGRLAFNILALSLYLYNRVNMLLSSDCGLLVPFVGLAADGRGMSKADNLVYALYY